jgi:drug/metabolite transporter (DMT)-like permease
MTKRGEHEDMLKNLSTFHKGVICIGVTTLAFSTMEITGKMISDSVHPFQMTFLRFLIGGLFLFPFAVRELKQRQLRLKAADFLFFALTGVIGIVISMCIFQTAVLYTKAAVVAVIFSSNPLFTAPLARLILKEKMGIRKWIALALSVLGIVLIFNPFSISPDIKGMALALASAVSFSLYSVISKTRVERYGGLVLNSFSFLEGSAILLIVILPLGIPVFSGIGNENITQLIYLGVFVTGIGYFCYLSAMKYTSAITASIVFFIKPALASVLSLIILQERLGFLSIAGIALIITSSSLMLRQGKKV